MAKGVHAIRRCFVWPMRATYGGFGLRNLLCFAVSSYGRVTVPRRSYLTASYDFEDVWRSRLSGGLLSKLRHEEFYVELRKRLDANREVSAVDMDIFANLVQDQQTLGLLLELLSMLRKTAAAPRLLEATQFAVIQSCLIFSDYKRLINILQDRAKYGVFLTNDNACVVMDRFLMQKDYLNACRVAVEIMLQEDFGTHALSRGLALLSCLKFFESVVSAGSKPAVPVDGTEKASNGALGSPATVGSIDTLYPALPRVAQDEDEDADEMLIYVHFIKEPFFDDHFDLRKTRKLCGKTLYLAAVAGLKPERSVEGYTMVSNNSLQNTPARSRSNSDAQTRLPRNTDDEVLLNSSAILGMIMYRKLDKLKQFLTSAQSSAMSISKAYTDAKITELSRTSAADAPPNPKLPVANDLFKKVEQFFAVSFAVGHTADVADDQLHVMERPSDQHEILCKEPELNVTEQAQILAQLQQFTEPTDISMTDAAENLVRAMVKVYENINIPLRKEQFARWMKVREDNVEQEIKRHEIETRLQAISARRVELADEEDVLFFFERKSDWERMLDAETLQEIKAAEESEGAPYDYRVQEPGYEENQTPAATRSVLVKPYKAMQDAFDRKKQVSLYFFLF